jgi:hypothetical protein
MTEIKTLIATILKPDLHTSAARLAAKAIGGAPPAKMRHML